VSALSRMIEESEIPDEETTDQKENGGLALTIYLPDCNSLTVHVKETSNFRDVIQRTLVTHEKQGILPPLVYNDPGAYELRIHEGAFQFFRCFALWHNQPFANILAAFSESLQSVLILLSYQNLPPYHAFILHR